MADNFLMESLLQVLNPDVNWDKIKNIPWVLILAQQNKFGFSAFDYDKNVKTIL